MSVYKFSGITEFDSPLYIKKNLTDNAINYLTKGTVTSSQFTTNLSYVYDFNSSSVTSGTSDGSGNARIYIDFGASLSPILDTILLCNTINTEILEFYGSPDNVTYTLLDTLVMGSPYNFDFILFKITNLTGYRYYEIIFNTLGVAETISLGEVVLCNSSYLHYVARPWGVATVNNNYFEKIALNELIEGGLIGGITSVKYGSNYTYEWLPQADRDNLKLLKDNKTDFGVVPHPTGTNEIYKVYWTNPWDFSHTDKTTGAGYSGSIEVREL